MRRAVAGGAGGGRSDAATASHLNAATFPESKECGVYRLCGRGVYRLTSFSFGTADT